MVTQTDLLLRDGRTLHPYDALAEGAEDHLASAEFDPELFTPADHSALAGAWSWLLTVVEQAMEGGLGGMVDDAWPVSPRGGSTLGRCARRWSPRTAARRGAGHRR